MTGDRTERTTTEDRSSRETAEDGKSRWQKPTLRRHGTISDLVNGGGGKLSLSVDGDGRKPSGTG